MISIEVDGSLADAAMEGPWPPHVQVINADAVDVLRTLGAFNLVFVDASPVKQGHMGAAIDALQPGGVMIVDDLHTDMKNFELQKAHKDALRRFLLSHPDLQAVELDWASGVLLVTSTRTAG